MCLDEEVECSVAFGSLGLRATMQQEGKRACFVERNSFDIGHEGHRLRTPLLKCIFSAATSEEFLELVKSSLLAALEDVAAINPGALFGLITFSQKIGLYDVQGPIPVVKYVSIPPDMDGKLPVDLDMAMPLPAFLAPWKTTRNIWL